MKVTLWESSDAAQLTDFYNEQIAPISYCLPVTPEEFDLGYNFRINPWPEEDNTGKELVGHSERKLIVVEQSGEIVGFADVGKQVKDNKTETVTGLIRTMMYRPGYRPVGQAILEQAEKYFRDLGLSKIEAFTHSQYSFFRFGAGALPRPLLHVQALLGMSDYSFAVFENDGHIMGWLLFHWPEYQISEPRPPESTVEIAVKHLPSRGQLPHLEIKAFRKETLIASSWSSSVESYCLNSEARTTFYTDSVDVEQDEQGKGWGRYLMERTLWEMRKLGYQNATLSCSLPNYKGHLLYTNLGYRVVDSSCAFIKDFDGHDDPAFYKSSR